MTTIFKRFGKTWQTVLVVFTITLLCIIAYSYTLRLPLFWDDLWHYPYVTRSWKPLLASWRPLQFNLYRLMMVIQGQVDPTGQHLIAFMLHVINSCLVYLLINLVVPKSRTLAFVSACFFALYPFSAEAVSWVAAATHSLVTMFSLGAVTLYLIGQSRKHLYNIYYIMSIGCAFLAPFANESGILIIGYLAAILVIQRKSWRTWPSLLPYLACALFGYYIQQKILPNDNRMTAFSLEVFTEKIPYLAQGLLYPLAPIAAWIYRKGITINRYLFSALFYGISLIGYFILLYRYKLVRYGLFALAWYVIATAPLLTLSASHVLVGYRLLYLASPGAALLAALPITRFVQSWLKPLYRLLSVGALVALVMLASVPDLISTRAMNLQIKAAVDNLKTTLVGIESPILILNYPNSISLKEPHFLLGQYPPCITASKSPEDLSDLLLWNGAPGYKVSSYNIADSYKSDKQYNYFNSYFSKTREELLPLLRNYPHIYTTRLGEAISIQEIGGMESPQASNQDTFRALFADQLTLLTDTIVANGRNYAISLRWQCLQSITQETQVFVHVYDQDGNLVVGQDIQPLLGMSDLRTWKPGDIWRDVRYISLPENTSPGDYTMVVGMYTMVDVVRLPAYNGSGQRLDGDVVYLGTITVP